MPSSQLDAALDDAAAGGLVPISANYGWSTARSALELGFLRIALPPRHWDIRKFLMRQYSTAIVCASVCMGWFSRDREVML